MLDDPASLYRIGDPTLGVPRLRIVQPLPIRRSWWARVWARIWAWRRSWGRR